MDDLHRLAVSRGYEGPLPSLELALRLDRVASDLIERLRLSGEADELLGATPLPESAPTDDGAARDDPEAVCAQLLESEAARTQRLLREARLRSERATRDYQEQRRGVDAHRDSIRASLSELSSMLGTLGRVWGRALDPAAGAGFDCAGDSLLESLSSLLDAASKGASGEGTADAPEREERRWREQAAELQRLQRALTAAMSGAARAGVASARQAAAAALHGAVRSPAGARPEPRLSCRLPVAPTVPLAGCKLSWGPWKKPRRLGARPLRQPQRPSTAQPPSSKCSWQRRSGGSTRAAQMRRRRAWARR
jgi:hypothetical protein